MTPDTPSPLVPTLRFPEFRNGPRWDLLTLSSASDVNPSNDGLPEFFIYIDLESVKSSMLVGRKEISRDAAPSRAQRLLSRKDIIYQTVRPYQRNNLLFDIDDGYEYVASTGYAQLRAHECPEFLYQLLHTDSFVNSVLARCTGSNYPSINPSALASIRVALPRKPEQHKIADCLGSLDDLIAAEGRKLEALWQHKLGLMQQLFPQAGETVPRLRFPEFSEDGAWEETAIGNMGEVITGSTPSTSRRDFYGGDFMFVSPADISDLRFVEETKTTLTEAGFAECRPIKKNSVLFVCIGSIGRVAQCSRPCATNQQINSLVTNDAFVADFAYYLLDRESLRIARLAGTQVLPIINKSLFAAVKVTVPAVAEQQRIADCLSSHDARIAAQLEKLETLKQHKRGLMQQLFPKPETA